jgi:toxin HigB-1
VVSSPACACRFYGDTAIENTITPVSYRLSLYTINVVRSFGDPETERLFNDLPSRRFQSIERIARRKLVQIDQACALRDLSALPGNRLEALKGDRNGQYSIRINDRFRICFVWSEGDALDVEIVDYH